MTVAEMEALLADARAALAAAPEAEKPALEAQIGRKAQELEALKAGQTKEYATEHEHYLALLSEKREKEIAGLADQAAKIRVDGFKAQIEADNSRIQQLVDERVNSQVAAMMSGAGFKSAVVETLAGARTPRRTPVEQSEHAQTYGTKAQAPGQLRGPRGEKGSFGHFVLALGSKDLGAILDMQKDANAEWFYGAKALTGGLGAGNPASGPSGGYLVPPQYVLDIVQLLYPYVILRRAGAEVIEMESPQLLRPRLSSGSTATYVGEVAPIPVSQPVFDQFALNAKDLTALVPVSKNLVMNSSPKVEGIVKADLAMQIGLKEDVTFLVGTGSLTVPQGLLTRSDITIIAPATNGDPVNYDVVVDLETALDTANIPDINRIFVGHPRIRATLRKLKDTAGRPIFTEYYDVQQSTLLPGRPNGPTPPRATLFGRPFYTSSQIPIGPTGTAANTSLLALMEMSEIKIGQIEGLELDSSEEASYVDGGGATVSAFQNRVVLYRGVMRHDIAPLHGGAIAVHNGLIL